MASVLKNIFHQRDKASIDWWLVISITLVAVLLPLIWTLFIVQSLGPEAIHDAMNSGKPSYIFAFGAFGSSFGIFAAMFAGIATVLLYKNLEISQRELSELRGQMEIDRNLNTFLQLLDILRSVRENLKNSDRNHKDQIGKDVLVHYSLWLQDIRRKGHFDVDNPRMEMKKFFHRANHEQRNFTLSVSDYCYACMEIVSFISEVSEEERTRFVRLMQAVVSLSETILLHEWFLVNTGSEFHEKLLQSKLFHRDGLLIRVTLKTGPFFKPEVYGQMVVNAVKEGTLT